MFDNQYVPVGHDGVVTHTLPYTSVCKCRLCKLVYVVIVQPGIDLVHLPCPNCGLNGGDIFYGREHVIKNRTD